MTTTRTHTGTPPLLSRVAAGFRILADTAAFRLSKREGGNLATSTTMALALALPIGDVAFRLVFGIVLNLFVYLLNDCIDVRIDLVASGRDVERTRFLHEHIRVGWTVVFVLGASLAVLGAAHSAGLLVAFLVNAVLIVLYSRWLKRLPVVDILAMAGWGVGMAMVGFPLDSHAGWRFAGLLGILCAVTEVIQTVRDASSDRRAGLRTTAVMLGAGPTVWLARGLILTAAAYTFLVLDSIVAAALLPALIVPLDEERAVRTWDRLRIIFAIVWLALLICFRFDLGPGGWLMTRVQLP